jgi:hypothetical protein
VTGEVVAVESGNAHAVTTETAHEHGQQCGNCEAVLTGPFCAQCGQHAHASARNLAAVVHDGWHDLTHVDGRLWNTLRLLMLRPGQLTVDFFADRRARYLPPVRLYLVLSVVFFSFSFTTHETHQDPGHAVAAAASTKSGPAKLQSDAGDDEDSSDDDDDSLHSTVNINCDDGDTSLLAKTLCENGRAKTGSEFTSRLAHNTPKMMFVFLPLMAAVMLLLYWRPRRYYVEHLVYLLHNHSALYLAFSLMSLVSWLGRKNHALHWLGAVAIVLTLCYAVWYPFRSMRRYYAQGSLLTLGKYTLIAAAYAVSLLFTYIGAAILTALTGD